MQTVLGSGLGRSAVPLVCRERGLNWGDPSDETEKPSLRVSVVTKYQQFSVGINDTIKIPPCSKAKCRAYTGLDFAAFQHNGEVST